MNSFFRAIFIFAIVIGLGIGFSGCTSDEGSPTGPTLNPPENLTVVANSASSVTLSWSDIGNVELGFRVQRTITGTTDWQQLAEVGANVLTYTDTGLGEGTSYSYRVAGFMRNAESGFSSVVAVQTPPIAPSNLVAVGLGVGEVELTWIENSSIEDGIRIQRSLNTSTGFETIIDLAANEVSYVDAGLALNTRYYYRAGAFKGENISAWSNLSNVMTIAGPQNLVAEAEGDSRIILNWEDENPLEYGFSVQRAPYGTTDWNSIATSLDTTTFNDTRLDEGTSYLYRVKSTGRGIESPYSNEASATTMLSAPAGLAVTQEDPGSLIIRWRDYSHLEEIYQLQRGISETGSFLTIAELPPDTRMYTDSDLSGDITFYYRVRVIAGELSSLWSETANVTTSAPPANLRSTVLSDTSIQLDWDDVSDNETGYFVQIALAGSPTWMPLAELDANEMTFSHFRLEEGTSYQYRVNSFTEDAESPYTNPVVVTTFPKPPSGFSAVRTSTSSILISWLDNSRYETSFEIQRALAADGQFEVIAIPESNQTSFVDTELEIRTTYFYRMRANQGMQASFWTVISSATTAIFTPAAPTGLQVDNTGRYDATLSWTDNADNERGFSIEYQESEEGGWRLSTTIRQADVETYTVLNLRSNWTYSLRVNAYNDSGRSDYTNVVQAMTEPWIPVAPTNLRADAPDHRSVVITWEDKSHDEDGFIIQKRETMVEEWSHFDSTDVDVELVTDTEVEPRLQYEYRAAAYNQYGRSLWSNTFRAQVPQAPILDPTELEANPLSFSSMRLTWVDRPRNEEGFTVERRLTGEGEFEEIGEAPENIPSYIDNGLERGTSYEYRVSAYRGGGSIKSEYSNIATSSTYAELGAPANFAVMPNGMSSLWLNWTDCIFQDGFRVERRLEGQGEFEQVVETDLTTIVDTGLEQETTYEYRVLAFVDYQGEEVLSEYSDVASGTTLGEIAFFDDYEDYELDAPPVRDEYTITAPGESTVLVTEASAYDSNQGLEFDDPTEGDNNYVQLFVEHGPVNFGSVTCWLKLAPAGYFGLIGANAADIITWQLQFNPDSTYLVRNGGALEVGGGVYPIDEWFQFRLDYDVPAQSYSVFFNDELASENMQLQQPDQINTKFLLIVYSGVAVIDYVYVDDLEVRRIDPDARGFMVPYPGSGDNQNAMSISDYLRIGPVR